MPGLIDAHAHVMASDLNLAGLPKESATLLTARSIPILRNLLMKGFTAARDAGGADWGLVEAVDTGLIPGPRLFISGKGIAQTGGQGDFRARNEVDLPDYCAHALGSMSRVADGVDQVRHAVREELRRGAHQIKIFAGGGIAGGVPLQYSHFTVEEIRAAVEEARAVGTYVMAHAYAAESILRAVEAGARTIEHGNLITEEVARQIAGRAYVVPTLSALEGRFMHADELGLAPVRQRIRDAVDSGLRGIEICRRAGVKVGFGSDLEGIIHPYHWLEFQLRSQVQSPLELVQSATLINAEILQMEGQLGVVEVDALADLVIIDGNPCEDASILINDARPLGVIKGGEVVRYDY
ncbi:metal-dependent hydrolase family protein [Nocardioides sp. PD653]|uniref:metal-dependent hydrolase family protein n=2 Tax=unclassified Nocardioides TaxID=2615069 RepID=UPI0024187F18|nr:MULTISPECIES: amidohydrolase family protein [unclassified Nocardioides]